jgi:carboxylesterase type B
MIKKSIVLGQEVVFVAVNSRISGFGFLGGQELKADGSTNLGLRDQRYVSSFSEFIHATDNIP